MLLLYVLAAVLGLILLVAKLRLHAFLALMIASLFVGVCSGMPLGDIAKAFQQGVGNTLGFIAIVVGLGAVLGKLLAESGGAEVVARRFIGLFGGGALPWAMLLVGFVVGIPVFFGVGMVLLMPVLASVVRESKTRMLTLALPMVAGLSACHGLVPPHPGPMVAIELLGASPGRTILYALLVAFPAAIAAGPVFARFVKGRVDDPEPLASLTASSSSTRPPRFDVTIFTILLPVLLMLAAAIADIALPEDNRFRGWAGFLGNPLVSLLVAVLAAFYFFGIARGFRAAQLLKFTEDCIGPVAGIVLVVGAGGGFSKVLDASGAGAAIAGFARDLNLSLLVMAWLIAALIRIAVGSATVAITMTAGLIAPMLPFFPRANRELLVLAMGAGSVVLSHLNDGGFWFVKEYLNLSVPQTLKTWTVLETIISIVAFGLILLLNALV